MASQTNNSSSGGNGGSGRDHENSGYVNKSNVAFFADCKTFGALVRARNKYKSSNSFMDDLIDWFAGLNQAGKEQFAIEMPMVAAYIRDWLESL